MVGRRAPRHGRRWAASASSVVVTAALASCGMPSTTAGGDAATWTVTRAPEPAADGAVVHLAVTRLGCASGVTGRVLEPTVVVEEGQVVIDTRVEHVDAGECPGNDTEMIQLELGPDAVGKDLVDAACLGTGEAAGTPACETGPVRWHLPVPDARREMPGWAAPEAYRYQVTSLCGERAFVGTFEIDVAQGEVTGARQLGEDPSDLALATAPTLEELLEETAAGVRARNHALVAMTPEGDPRYLSVGRDLADSDGTSCYLIHQVVPLEG
ncbi:hypothetical protein [Serinicoccus marinus]|uniref:hypothetical protein n=1 Tax=Serinicoccus marinus TaxID=247333 RepID=UPI0003B43C01|nr:hypothetical protein [Serinicoccus marinus]